ncbi:MAG: hypothetical protein A3C90_03975 [Candidatus Magasanikbacteria bacterium RIFCSPHIGHO2_02_FULL_51_14]|uniref:Uncharacterized protein n=1 Tax=Candidatus Magasanikbacteria bacterium RIFCSPHIGHO2_02_FULL_51_14 TaxID=1798683 RepID=A0A1F6MNM4_9BACT|nr:MAG: hypothetical protein A3C90_03975 [Candidatus Magasanikbacteria bacterium RIFCSPHIGHO2_02_FULL_51_14]
MTLRQYLTIMIAATTLSWISWGIVLMNVDPFTSGPAGFIFFYATLFLAFLGTVSIASYLLRSHLSDELTPLFRVVLISFRDGAASASVLAVALLLMSAGLLRVWSIGLLALIVLLIVFFILSARRAKPRVT